MGALHPGGCRAGSTPSPDCPYASPRADCRRSSTDHRGRVAGPLEVVADIVGGHAAHYGFDAIAVAVVKVAMVAPLTVVRRFLQCFDHSI